MVSISSLKSYLQAGNEIPLNVTASNYETSSGAICRFQLKFRSGPSDGDTLTFGFTDQDGVQRSIVMTAKDNPDDSGTQFRTNVNSLSMADYVDLVVVPALKRNYQLFSNFIIAPTTEFSGPPNNADEIFGDGRVPFDAAFNLSSSNQAVMEFIFSDNGSDQTFAANYSLICDIWMEQTYQQEDYERLMRLKKVPQLAGNTYESTFYLQSIVNNDLLRAELPAFKQDDVKKVTGPLKTVFVRCAEQYGSPVDLKQYVSGPSFVAFRGGLPYMSREDETDFEDEWISNGRFLTQYPFPKKVKKDQQELLYYFNSSNSTRSIRLDVIIYYNDGTQQQYTSPYGSTSMDPDTLYAIPVGYQELGLPNQVNSNKTVKAYEVNLIDSVGNDVSDTKRFVIDRKVYPSDHRFLFENDFGVFETIRLTGKQTYSYEVQRSTIRLSQLGHDRTRPEYEHYNTRSRNLYTGQTGYMSKARLLDFERFLRSKHVYRMVEDSSLEDNGLFVPVVVEGDSFEQYQDDQGLFALSFNYKDAFHV